MDTNKHVRVPFAPQTKEKEAERIKQLISKIVTAMDEQVRQIGQQTVEAIIKAVRTALEDIWKVFGIREASIILKDVPIGRKVHARESQITESPFMKRHYR